MFAAIFATTVLLLFLLMILCEYSLNCIGYTVYGMKIRNENNLNEFKGDSLMEQSILMIATDSTYQFYFSKMLPHRLANRRLRENQPNEKG